MSLSDDHNAIMLLLEACGLTQATLRSIAEQAQREQVHPDLVAVSHGHLTHAALMQGLAGQLRCHYLPDVSGLEISADFAAFRQPIVRVLHRPDFAVLAAPTGGMLAQLLLRQAESRPWLVLTSSVVFREKLRTALADLIAGNAALPPRMRARLQLADGEAVSPSLRIAAFAIGTAAGAGLMMWPWHWLVIVAAIASPLFFHKIILRLAAAVAQPVEQVSPRLLTDATLPRYAVIVPLFREARVVGQLLDALLRIDYPRSKLSILLVLEEADGETLAAIQERPLPSWIDVVRVPAGLPQTKPRALNVALAQTGADLVAVFDAEDLPDPDQLKIAATYLALAPASVGAVQARLEIDNASDGLVANLFALEYATLFRQFNPYLNAIGSPFLLGGTSNHFRGIR